MPYKAGCAPRKKWDLPTTQLISNGQSYEEFVLNLLEGSKEETKEILEVKGR
jgi:hypothetical protein